MWSLASKIDRYSVCAPGVTGVFVVTSADAAS